MTKAGVGTNRYSYSFNDPVNLRDPNGNEVTRDDSEWGDLKDEPSPDQTPDGVQDVSNYGPKGSTYKADPKQFKTERIIDFKTWFNNAIAASNPNDAQMLVQSAYNEAKKSGKAQEVTIEGYRIGGNLPTDAIISPSGRSLGKMTISSSVSVSVSENGDYTVTGKGELTKQGQYNWKLDSTEKGIKGAFVNSLIGVGALRINIPNYNHHKVNAGMEFYGMGNSVSIEIVRDYLYDFSGNYGLEN